MKKDMPLEGLRWSRDSGSALYDTPQNGRSRTGWGGTFKVHPLLEHSINEVDGFLLLLVHDFSIDFRGLNVGMSHQLACGKKVCTEREHHRSECVP